MSYPDLVHEAETIILAEATRTEPGWVHFKSVEVLKGDAGRQPLSFENPRSMPPGFPSRYLRDLGYGGWPVVEALPYEVGSRYLLFMEDGELISDGCETPFVWVRDPRRSEQLTETRRLVAAQKQARARPDEARVLERALAAADAVLHVSPQAVERCFASVDARERNFRHGLQNFLLALPDLFPPFERCGPSHPDQASTPWADLVELSVRRVLFLRPGETWPFARGWIASRGEDAGLDGGPAHRWREVRADRDYVLILSGATVVKVDGVEVMPEITGREDPRLAQIEALLGTTRGAEGDSGPFCPSRPHR